MSQFKGIFQVTGRKYASLAQSDKLGYLFLVRDGIYSAEGADAPISEVKSEKIYFGSRLYSDNSAHFEGNLIDAFGGLLDAEGSLIFPAEANGDTFANVDETQVNTFLELLQALDAAITANKNKFADYYTQNEIDGKVTALQNAIALCVKSISVKVGDASYSGVMGENGAVEVDLSAAFEAAGKVKDVTVDGKSVMDGTTAKIDLSGKADLSLVNALSGRVDVLEAIKHADDVVYDSTGKTIYLTANGEKLGEGFDASSFLVDGMIESVGFKKTEDGSVTTVLEFVFNTDGGQKVIPVDLKDYIDTYYADETSITLDTKTKTFSVKEVDADKVDVVEIPVGGTPLADILLGKGVTSISAGNLQSVLEGLFSQNLWPEKTPIRNVPTALSVSMNAPTIVFTPTATTVEVGSTINVTATAKTASASASISYENFEYGWSAANDSTRDGEGNPSSVSITGTKDEGSDYKLSFVTNNGFNKVDIADVTGSTLASTALTVEEGTNKITVTASSPTFTATVPGQNAVYICSSLKKTDAKHVVAATTATTITGSVKTNTGSDSVTGAYYAFVGFSDTLPTTSDEYRAFIGNNFTRLGKGSVAAGTCTKTYMAVCIPSGWDFTCNTSLGADMRNSFTETDDVDITLPNGATKAYKYYALTYKDGAFKDLVIK